MSLMLHSHIEQLIRILLQSVPCTYQLIGRMNFQSRTFVFESAPNFCERLEINGRTEIVLLQSSLQSEGSIGKLCVFLFWRANANSSTVHSQPVLYDLTVLYCTMEHKLHHRCRDNIETKQRKQQHPHTKNKEDWTLSTNHALPF